MFILSDIIEIRSQIVNIINIQIKYLEQSDFATVKDLKCIEKELINLLNCKHKKIKSSINVILSYKDQETIELLNNGYLDYRRILEIRNNILISKYTNKLLKSAVKPMNARIVNNLQ
ncbi:hypothetical protein [Ehrlichia canis]|uniref:Uncharacterized protein n=1 Tax=Ehrlichia canis (strain Jake) TaxID=269484 RepID=A0ACA6AVY5_EHRCJ|nr:hypothetical protein [Ehrlichia canis]AAZ68403.1 hypothetical protein Ecaj_0360 [Ehrlichia canis str. Jake]UKC53781.1 hypothetical protein s20019040002_000824 [Ehrlichia canis]UKC54718.1 hypothetical protein s20026770001_000824 [Ehrlichia canis]UKC55654.1 hypothetical protein s21009500007_000824 [Ehrlichia canis]